MARTEGLICVCVMEGCVLPRLTHLRVPEDNAGAQTRTLPPRPPALRGEAVCVRVCARVGGLGGSEGCADGR